MKQKGFTNIALIFLFVVIAGAVGYFALRKPTIEQTRTANTSSSANETENWITYRNERLGFEFQYPEDFFATPQLITSKGRIIGDINDVDDKPSDREYLSSLQLCYLSANKNCSKKEGEIIKNGLVMNFVNEDSGYKTYQDLLPFYSQDTNYSRVTIGGAVAYKRNNGPRNEVALIKLRQPYFIYTLQVNAYKDTCVVSPVECGLIEVEDSKTKILYEQILSTFRFDSANSLNNSPVDWKIYRVVNEYQFNYPPSWKPMVISEQSNTQNQVVNFVNVTGKTVATLQCSIREVGYEPWKIDSEDRRLEAIGKGHGATLWTGTATDLPALHIVFMYRGTFPDNWGNNADDHRHSCELRAVDANDSKDMTNIFKEIYRTVSVQ